MSYLARALLVVLVLSLPLGIVGADDGSGPAHDATYTAEELTALRRVLHAANMTPEDLAFRKDLTEGHGCLPLVRDMLADPLSIAVGADELARPAGPADLVVRAARLLDEDAPDRPAADGGQILAPQGPRTLISVFIHLLEGASEGQGLYHPLVWPEKRLGPDPVLERMALRRLLPVEMAWHDVFASPFDAGENAEIDAFLEAQDAAWVHEQGLELSLARLAGRWLDCFHQAPETLALLPDSLFPTDEPLVVETLRGRIALGTPGDDVYTGEYAVLVDPGGDDRYVGCRLGAAFGTQLRPLGLFADLGGNDVYECANVNVTLGAAILGVAAFYDLGQGDDRYEGGHCSLGASMDGVAVFYDDGGSDLYTGKTYTQGAAGFGIGIFFDDALQAKPKTSSDEGTEEPVRIGLFDNDRLHAWSNAQAFARCRGVALCVNERGNDIYEAGGVYLHAPLFADRYQSFSQGFAIGQRGIDYAGGIALLIDRDGNDRYLGDIYNQGVGYWYGAGLLWDGGGNDTYEMTQYGQGSGIHLAVGGLVDVAGHDTYVMHSGLGQGSSHDYAASILHDRAGNDRYLGTTSCNGAALTNSVGIHIDRSGDDLYAGRRSGSINFGRPARGFSSIGVLLDLGGKDDYLGRMEDDTLWRHTDIGVGQDLSPEPAEPGPAGVTPAADQPTGQAEIPAICSYEGELTDAVFDELWAIAIRWEVGDNRAIVPKARERLLAFGPPVLALMDAKVEQSASGLELRAYEDVLKGLSKAGHESAVHGFLRANLAHETPRRKRVALHLVGALKVLALEEAVVALLTSDDEALARRTAGVLGAIRSHGGDEILRTWLDGAEDERKIQTALGVLLGLESDVYAAVRPLLDHPLLSVRTRLIALLTGHASAYLDHVRSDLMAGDISERARRSLLEVLVQTVPAPDAGEVLALSVLLEHPDWGMRADAVRLIRRWEADPAIDAEHIEPALSALALRLDVETDPYVRFCARSDQR